jgi:hypothetical protein
MEGPGGICDQLDKLSLTAQQAKIGPIIQEVNSKNNLVFLREDAEFQKGQYTQDFLANNPTKLANPVTPFALLAVKDYLDKTRSRSIQVAKKLDALITTHFGAEHANVEKKWKAYLAQVRKQEAVSRAFLEQLQKDAVAQ